MIEAMKLAIEAMEEWDNYLGNIDFTKEIAALCQAIAEAEKQEPVAYPKGYVVGPCVCGSWPGGECLKCPRVNHPLKREWPDDEFIKEAKRRGFLIENAFATKDKP